MSGGGGGGGDWRDVIVSRSCTCLIRIYENCSKYYGTRCAGTMYQVYDTWCVLASQGLILLPVLPRFCVCLCHSESKKLSPVAPHYAHWMPVSYDTILYHDFSFLGNTVKRACKHGKALWFRTPQVRSFLHQVPGV